MGTYHRSKCLLIEAYSRSLHSRVESGVREQSYTEDVGAGFRLLARRTDHFFAEYIERQIREEHVTDPFGRVTTFERIVYVTTALLVSVQPPHIILLDPPSTSKKVVHILCGFVDYRTPVVAPTVDVGAWARAIEASPLKMCSDEVRVQDVQWGEGFSGAVFLAGEGNIFGKTESLLAGRAHCLASVAGSVLIDETRARIRIHRTGRVELARAIDAKSHAGIHRFAG